VSKASVDAHASVEASVNAESQEFLIIRAQKCRAQNASADIKALCADNYAPSNLNSARLRVLDENRGLVRISGAAGSAADDLELLCYRCAFGKIDAQYCGRYEANWNKPERAKKCPAAK